MRGDSHRGIFCAHFPVSGRMRRLFSRRACILLSNESEGGDGVKQLRFVILIMLIMLLLCPAARAALTPGSANTEQMGKPPASQEVFPACQRTS